MDSYSILFKHRTKQIWSLVPDKPSTECSMMLVNYFWIVVGSSVSFLKTIYGASLFCESTEQHSVTIYGEFNLRRIFTLECKNGQIQKDLFGRGGVEELKVRINHFNFHLVRPLGSAVASLLADQEVPGSTPGIRCEMFP